MSTEHALTIPGRYEQIQKVCKFVAGGAREAGLDSQAIFHVELCCDEACTNIIEHAYGAEGAGEITVSYQSDDEDFVIIIHDNGRSFDPDDVPPPPSANADKATDIVDNLQVGGLGIHFMRELMDSVQFHFDDKTGNTLIMTKKLSQGTDSRS